MKHPFAKLFINSNVPKQNKIKIKAFFEMTPYP
jgi:hypothetical protein